MVTPGYLMIPGDGHAITMVAGHMTPTMAGFGYPVMNGHLHGLAGALAVGIPAGRHLDPEQGSPTIAHQAGGYS